MNNVSILIVTFSKDFPWLRWCLKSINKYARGFKDVVVALPEDTPYKEMATLLNPSNGMEPVIITFHPFQEWPGKGFLCHEYQIICADMICPESDFILHMDSDCVFVENVTPSDYFVGNNPVLIHARYDWIVKKFNNPYHYEWKKDVERAIGGTVEREFMRRHPAVHHRKVYDMTRQLILKHTGQSPDVFIQSQQATFPQGFAEFPTLGEVAWRHFHDQYHWINQETEPWPKDKLIQFHSHTGLENANPAWMGGELRNIIPLHFFEHHKL